MALSKTNVDQLFNKIQRFADRPKRPLDYSPAERKEMLRKYIIEYLATRSEEEYRGIVDDVQIERVKAEEKK
ncbi:MAG TPA: hypothetical protein ENN69_00825 [Spirochaetia bacterium]|nr:hypothetical protein [Spirochaetia bacterium]